MKRLGTQPFSERIERANKLINRMQFAHGFKTKTAKCATANIDCFGEIISWVNYGFLRRRRTISRCHFINVSLGWRRQFDAFCSLITFKYSLLCVLNNLPFLTSSLAHLLRLSGNSVEKNFWFTQIYIVVEFWYQGFVFTGRLLFSWSVSSLWVLSFSSISKLVIVVSLAWLCELTG